MVYSVLDANGQRLGKPLKSSLFGKPYGFYELEKRYEKANETIKKEGIAIRTRALASASLTTADNSREFLAKLQEQGIDLALRYNDGGRLVGATYINHNDRTVLNGSVLGKEFSANKLAERFADFAKGTTRTQDIQSSTVAQMEISRQSSENMCDTNVQPYQSDNQSNKKDHSIDGEIVGGLLSILTPEVHPDDNQLLPKPRKKIKRKYGRQM